MSRSRGSPPGFSSTSVICPLSWERARGRTAHDRSSSALNEYSCSILLRLSGAGRVETGARRRTDGASTWFGGWPRDKGNSSSFRRGSSTYSESSTMIVLHFHVLHSY